MDRLRPEKFGDVPRGLQPYHAEFLRRLRDAVEVMVGAQRSQLDTAETPGSQVVTFDDLEEAISDLTIGYSKIFMHMGAP